MEDTTFLTSREVAEIFRVNTKTVTRWAASGQLGSIRTSDGHRRFPRQQIRELLSKDADPRGSE